MKVHSLVSLWPLCREWNTTALLCTFYRDIEAGQEEEEEEEEGRKSLSVDVINNIRLYSTYLKTEGMGVFKLNAMRYTRLTSMLPNKNLLLKTHVIRLIYLVVNISITTRLYV